MPTPEEIAQAKRKLASLGRQLNTASKATVTRQTNSRLAKYADDPMAFIEDLRLPTPSAPRFGDAMASFQRTRLRKLVPDLHALVAKEAPPIGKHWWEATKGASKDTDLAAAVIWLLAFARRPLRGQAGAADAKQASEIRLAATEWLSVNPWLQERIVVQRSAIISPKTGSRLDILTADKDTAHGARPDFLVVNELHAIGSQEVAETWVDNADKIPWGVRVIATNAGFQNSWQWKWREIAREGAILGTWFFHKYAEPAPWMSMVKLAESKRRNSASRYLRLWQGVWVQGTGDALDPGDVAACVNLKAGVEPNDKLIFLGGLDLGVRHDHSGFLVVGVEPQGQIQLALCKSWAPGLGGKVDLISVRDEVKAAARKYDIKWLGFDPSQAELMAQELEQSGVPMCKVEFRGKMLDRMARDILQTFRNRKIALYDDPGLVNDLYRLTIVERSYGYKLTAISDDTGHADRAIALAITLPLALEIAMEDVIEYEAEPEPCRVTA